MPTVQAIEGEVTVNGEILSPTDLETTVTASSTANKALIDGFMETPEGMSLNDDVRVTVNGRTIFVGNLKRATQNISGEVSIEAYGLFADLHGKNITLQTEDKHRPDKIAQDLLRDTVKSLGPGVAFTGNEDSGSEVIEGTGIEVSNISIAGPETVRIFHGTEHDPSNLPPGSIYIEDTYSLGNLGEGFVTPPSPTHLTWGSGQRGESLVGALEWLSDLVMGTIWCDHRNVLRFEGYPEHIQAQPGPTIETNVGPSEEDSIARVIVQSSAGSVGSDPAASYVHAKTSPQAQTSKEDGDGETVTLQDDNIVDQTSAEAASVSELLNVETSQEQGELTLVGTALSVDGRLFPQPWDSLFIPPGSDDIPLPGGEAYTISSVNHVFNVQNGWETKVSLVGDPFELLGGFTESELTNAYRSKIENQEQIRAERTLTDSIPIMPSGLGPGIISDLL